MNLPINDPVWQAEFLRQRRLDASQIPPRYRLRTLDTYRAETPERERMLQRMRDYLAAVDSINGLEERNGLLLFGPKGTGKTHLLCGVLMELIGRGRQGLYLSPIDWLTRIRSSFGRTDPGEDTELDILEEATHADVLMIDDLGIGKAGKEWEAEKIYQLIDGRFGRGAITLITCNPAFPDDLALHVGERVTSRLFEMCKVYNTVDWPDWREGLQKSKP
jgi:DNA replication protein DnaC